MLDPSLLLSHLLRMPPGPYTRPPLSAFRVHGLVPLFPSLLDSSKKAAGAGSEREYNGDRGARAV